MKNLKTPSARRWELWSPIIVVILVFLVWELLSRLKMISPLFFPAPSRIFTALYQLIINGEMGASLVDTLGRIGAGLTLGGIPGLLLGLAMGWKPKIRAMADPLVAALHPIPKVALFPLLMIILGIGEASKVAAIAIAAFFPLLINSMAGVRQLNPVYFEVARNLNIGRWKTFTRIVLPGSLPLVLAGARLAANMAMIITVTVELLAAKRGLGVLIWFAWEILRVDRLYATIIVVALLGVALNFLLSRLARWLSPWYDFKTLEGK